MRVILGEIFLQMANNAKLMNKATKEPKIHLMAGNAI